MIYIVPIYLLAATLGILGGVYLGGLVVLALVVACIWGITVLNHPNGGGSSGVGAFLLIQVPLGLAGVTLVVTAVVVRLAPHLNTGYLKLLLWRGR